MMFLMMMMMMMMMIFIARAQAWRRQCYAELVKERSLRRKWKSVLVGGIIIINTIIIIIIVIIIIISITAIAKNILYWRVISIIMILMMTICIITITNIIMKKATTKSWNYLSPLLLKIEEKIFPRRRQHQLSTDVQHSWIQGQLWREWWWLLPSLREVSFKK